MSKKSSVMESIVISLLGSATEFGGHLVDKLVANNEATLVVHRIVHQWTTTGNNLFRLNTALGKFALVQPLYMRLNGGTSPKAKNLQSWVLNPYSDQRFCSSSSTSIIAASIPVPLKEVIGDG